MDKSASTGYTSTFRRKECKYRVSGQQRREIASAILAHMHHDEHGACKVESLYFDTRDHSVICRSMEKPVFKEKLRIRTYGEADGRGILEMCRADAPVFVELKKKYKGIVYKRRIKISYSAAMEFLSGAPYCRSVRDNPMDDDAAQMEAMSHRSCQIAREIEAFANRGGSRLQPAMLISCEREAFSETPAEAERDAMPRELRITFDSNIRYKACAGFQGLSTEQPSGSGWQTLLDSNESIMEVKALGAYPLWLVRALQKSEASPSSFSKYGESFTASYRTESCKGAPAQTPSQPRGAHLAPKHRIPVVGNASSSTALPRHVAAVSGSSRC